PWFPRRIPRRHGGAARACTTFWGCCSAVNTPRSRPPRLVPCKHSPALQDTREGREAMVPRYIGLDLHARYVDAMSGSRRMLPDTKDGTSASPIPLTGGRNCFPQLDRTCWVALRGNRKRLEVHDVLSPHVDRVLLANPVDLK